MELRVNYVHVQWNIGITCILSLILWIKTDQWFQLKLSSFWVVLILLRQYDTVEQFSVTQSV